MRDQRHDEFHASTWKRRIDGSRNVSFYRFHSFLAPVWKLRARDSVIEIRYQISIIKWKSRNIIFEFSLANRYDDFRS